jgi:arginine exporter protein ArgO
VSRALVAGLVAGYGIAVPIGAVGTYLVSVSARSGVRRGAFGALGVASADALYAAVAVLGGAALASVVEPLARPLQLVSAVVLLGIALGIAVQTVRERTVRERTSVHRRGQRVPSAVPLADGVGAAEASGGRGGTTALARSRADGSRTAADVRTYLTFLGMTVLNPMTVVYFAALVLGGQGELFRSPVDRVVFVGAAALASASWQLLLATGGAVLGRLATGERGRLATGLMSSVLIAVLALRLL